jgi:hypothetical protein
VKAQRNKSTEPPTLIIPMSPEAAAIIHAHLPEPWVTRAKFVGPNFENLNADQTGDTTQDEVPNDE